LRLEVTWADQILQEIDPIKAENLCNKKMLGKDPFVMGMTLIHRCMFYYRHPMDSLIEGPYHMFIVVLTCFAPKDFPRKIFRRLLKNTKIKAPETEE
jgi:hypothetical protein